MSTSSYWQGQPSQATRVLVPPEKFEPRAPILSTPSVQGQGQGAGRDNTITFGGNKCKSHEH
eukprot:1968687-Prorocentrum_lima.AAC.1